MKHEALILKTKKEQLIEEALKLFNRKGFRATTMREIAEKMNFEVANIYNYVKSKQELLDDCILSIMNEFNQGVEQIISSSYSPKEKLHHIVAMHVHMIYKKPFHMALINNEWRHLEITKLKELLSQRKTYDEKVQEVVKEGIACGQFRNLNVEMTTLIILSTVRWLYDKYTHEGAEMNPIEIEKQITQFVFEGISKDKAARSGSSLLN